MLNQTFYSRVLVYSNLKFYQAYQNDKKKNKNKNNFLDKIKDKYFLLLYNLNCLILSFWVFRENLSKWKTVKPSKFKLQDLFPKFK